MRVEHLAPPPIGDDGRGARLSFGDGNLTALGDEMRRAGLGGRAFVIADQAVASTHGERVRETLQRTGWRPQLVTFASGEVSKSLDTAARLYGWLASHRAERRDTVVAVGGGVAGDLAGFVAATWLRGVPLVQVPTTLLAMVDSSVGGKAAVNIAAGKNLVGAFHPAALTLIDVRMLDGLPPREVRAGWAEVIKTAALFDPCLLDTVDGCDPITLPGNAMAAVIESAVRWKERVVVADPREQGLRIVLNFGHTVAHAIEAAAGYGAFRHGEAVAVGMVAATRLAVAHAGLDRMMAHRLEEIIATAGLPVRLGPQAPAVDEIISRTFSDKKVAAGQVRWVLPVEPGRCVVTDEVERDAVAAMLESLVE